VSALASQDARIPPASTTAGEWPQKLLILCVILSVSQALSPFPYLAALLLIGYILLSRPVRVDPSHAALALVLGTAAVLGFAISSDFANAARMLSTCALIVLVASLNLIRHQASFDFAARVVIVTLVLSVVGFVYALMGGPSLFTVTNADGREALLFLTTLSNAVFPTPVGNVIRPSFIYDEPGAYAFVIDAILLINFTLHRRLRRLDWALVAGGFITFSVAHVLVCFFLLVAARRTLYALLPLAVLGGLDYFIYQLSGVSLLFGRFAVEDGALAGDNRSDLFRTAVELVSSHPGGVGTSCDWDIVLCYDRYGAFGENPAFPAAYFGILPSLGYYAILLAVLVTGVTSRRRRVICTSLAILVLIMQRPFLFNIGYNLMIIMLFNVLLQRKSLHQASTR